jgi:hypothetical protein
VIHALDQLYDLDVICVDKKEDHRLQNWAPVGDTDRSSAQWKPHKFDLRPIYKLPIVWRNYGKRPR